MACVATMLNAIPTLAADPWSGSVSMTATAASYTTNDAQPRVTAVATPTLTAGYKLSIYNDLGQQVCVPGDYDDPSRCSTLITAPLNGSRTFTAYVLYGAPPVTGPPTDDVRATSTTVTISNVGYVNSSLSLLSTVTSYGTNDAQPRVTALATPALTGGYKLSIYNDLGQQVCVPGDYDDPSRCSTQVSAPLKGSRTFTAYVS
jgi:hypothetical protein